LHFNKDFSNKMVGFLRHPLWIRWRWDDVQQRWKVIPTELPCY